MGSVTPPKVKKNLLILIPILFLACDIQVAVNGQSEDTDLLTDKQSELIFKKTNEFPNGTQVSIAIVSGGETKLYGLRRKNDTIFSHENENKVFEIGSITKVFTSTLLANTVLEDKINLNDNIDDYLDFAIKNNIRLTFKQLANHTSGLPRMPSNLSSTLQNQETSLRYYDEGKLKQYLTEDLWLHGTPGVKFNYSNLGAGLLGHTLTKIHNTDYESLIQSQIFKKYKMTRSTSDRSKVKDLLVKGLDSDGDETNNLNLDVLVGGGGILSTSNDLSKFVNAQFDPLNSDLTLTRESTFTIDQNFDRGLAWRIIKKRAGENVYYHSGKTKGYTSYMAIEIKNKNAVVILSNVSGKNKKSKNIDELGFALMEILKSK